MALHKKDPKTILQEREQWVNTKTGETIEADKIVTKVERTGFEITYLMYLFNLFNELGGQKYKVVEYILKNKNAENTLIITQRELAKKADVGINTVSETIKILKEAQLITTRSGAIMIHPKIAHRGKVAKERHLIHKFETFNDDFEIL